MTTPLHIAASTQLAISKLAGPAMGLLLFLVIERNYLKIDLIVIGFIVMGLVLWGTKVDNYWVQVLNI